VSGLAHSGAVRLPESGIRVRLGFDSSPLRHSLARALAVSFQNGGPVP